MSRSRVIPYRKSLSSEYTSSIQVEKGSSDALKVDKDEIERTISILRDNYQIVVSGASKQLEVEINKLTKIANSLLGLESYNDFYRLIIKHFGDLEESQIVSGTIGAFCYGCNLYKSLSTGVKVCVPTCIGSIPTPNMPRWISCDSNVFILYRDREKKYLWKEIQVIAPDKLNYVFLIDDNDPDQSPIDYDVLRKKGIEQYAVYQMKEGMYKHIKSGKIEKELQLKTENIALLMKKSNSIKTMKKNSKKDIKIMGLVVVCVLIALIVSFVIGRRR